MTKTVLISIGSNTESKRQTALARRVLAKQFPGIKFTRSLTSEAWGGQGMYSNMLAEFATSMTVEELTTILKKKEKEMGDSTELRRQGKVMMDIDLLRYDETRHHNDDWERPYIKRLLKYAMRMILILMLAVPMQVQGALTKSESLELLTKAIEYFQGGKYHESILAFERLSKHYKLTPRYQAYLGMSYYKEMQYEEAVKHLTECLPQLKAYSPKEQAVYLYSCAESLFHLERYQSSITYYEKALPLVEGNDKGDVLFHDAFANYLIAQQCEDDINKDKYFSRCKKLFGEALKLYKANTDTATSLQVARLKQTETMLKGMGK